uniref:Succinate dehydrogenase assembly factor 3 n=1 Tax=Neospora caninum (strain Liverpool) TaxID=572307 RepID=A0A0F7UBZ2_NEOCL|nr:TPA: hypothetical protein BN1204_019675 [Neospora caninum Liverpool]
MASHVLVPLYDRLQAQLGEAVQLYRRVLRAHRTHLGATPMRQLADKFARAEFRAHLAAASEAATHISTASAGCKHTEDPDVPPGFPTTGEASESVQSDGGSPGCPSASAIAAFPPFGGSGSVTRSGDAAQETLSGERGDPQSANEPTGNAAALHAHQASGAREVAEAENVSKQLDLFTDAWREYLAFADKRGLRLGRHLRPAQRQLLSEDQKQQLQSIKDAHRLFREQSHKADELQ